MSDDNLIGHGSCPVCGNTKARFTFSKKKLACVVCNACNSQVFARSDNSDARLRALVKAVPVEVSKATVKEPEAPLDGAQDATKIVAVPYADVVKKTGLKWGFLGAVNG